MNIDYERERDAIFMRDTQHFRRRRRRLLLAIRWILRRRHCCFHAADCYYFRYTAMPVADITDADALLIDCAERWVYHNIAAARQRCRMPLPIRYRYSFDDYICRWCHERCRFIDIDITLIQDIAAAEHCFSRRFIIDIDVFFLFPWYCRCRNMRWERYDIAFAVSRLRHYAFFLTPSFDYCLPPPFAMPPCYTALPPLSDMFSAFVFWPLPIIWIDAAASLRCWWWCCQLTIIFSPALLSWASLTIYIVSG